jgi:hypothetical protein
MLQGSFDKIYILICHPLMPPMYVDANYGVMKTLGSEKM